MKINSKWSTDLNVRRITVTLLGGKHGRKSSWPGVRQRVLRHDINSKIIKEKLDKLHFFMKK